MPDPDEFLSAADAASELGLSASAVTRRAQMGTIPAFKVGRTWFIRRADLPVVRELVVPRRRRPATT